MHVKRCDFVDCYEVIPPSVIHVVQPATSALVGDFHYHLHCWEKLVQLNKNAQQTQSNNGSTSLTKSHPKGEKNGHAGSH